MTSSPAPHALESGLAADFEALRNLLVQQGWTAAKAPTLASKTFATAVGSKTAHAYLTSARDNDPNQTLFAQYWSEGRDILEPHGVLLPRGCGVDRLRALVEQFAQGVDQAVADSYAVRLLRS